MTKEFQAKLITRILLGELNETRDWPNDLVIKDLEIAQKVIILIFIV